MNKRFTMRGFTLIELLVVLVIVGLIIGFATLQLGGGGRDSEVRWQVRHLADALTLAVDEAQFASRNRGLALWRQDINATWQYSWFQQLDGLWQPLRDELDSVFADGQLSAHFNADLLIEDEVIVLPEDVDLSEPIAQPQIFFFSGGEATPFELTLWMEENASHYYRITADLLGRVSLVEQRDEL